MYSLETLINKTFLVEKLEASVSKQIDQLLLSLMKSIKYSVENNKANVTIVIPIHSNLNRTLKKKPSHRG